MGIETFGISIRFIEPGISPELIKVLSDFPEVHCDKWQTVGAYDVLIGEYNDGCHCVDFQLSVERRDEACILALRFSLCSYNGIDAVFLDLTRCFLTSFDAEVWLMTSAL